MKENDQQMKAYVNSSTMKFYVHGVPAHEPRFKNDYQTIPYSSTYNDHLTRYENRHVFALALPGAP